MRGGHSGIDIHKHRASANKILARALHLLAKLGDMRLMSIKGGTVHNAIARDAEATVVLRPGQFARMQNVIKDFEQTVLGEYATSEPSLALSISQVAYDSDSNTALTPGNTHKAIQLLLALPHGVTGMSEDPDNLVETSNNLATVEIKDKSLEILSSQRSSVMSRLEEITSRVEAAANLAGAEIKNENRYPAWQPDWSSPVLKRSQGVYQKLFSKTPKLQTIHAGLECGIIGSKHENMDMLSFGPTIENPHSPDERLFIPSIARVWEFLVAL
ncbi:MAG: peptidase dimerization domain-containing protein, partial [Planctomycetota bacterium]